MRKTERIEGSETKRSGTKSMAWAKHKGLQRLVALALVLILAVTAIPELTYKNTKAAAKQYGIIIGNKAGSYTYYDLNNTTGKTASIEITKAGNIMVPLKKLCSMLPGLTYSYNHAKKTATVINTNNGRKIVYTRSKTTFNYYSSPKAKAKKISMVYKMYVSSRSSSVMVHMSTLKYVMGTTSGYQYYRTADMQKAGYDTYTFSGLIAYNPYQSISAIPLATKVNGISSTIRVTVPEGYSVAQIFNLLAKKGVVASASSLYDTMESYNYNYYPLVSEIKADKNRCFKLEGYLYPDTYEFYRLSKPQDVIGKFLRNAEAKITDADRQKAKTMGYSVNQILTIASMIEKETADPDIMRDVASVIYNRLNIGMKLQFDSSINYVEWYIKPYISGDINRYNAYYNTYKCAALPEGPICNPGYNAIKAALNPSDTDYLYFYSDSDGYHFSVEYVNPKAPTPTVIPVPTDTVQ